jgi:hypothetical protein
MAIKVGDDGIFPQILWPHGIIGEDGVYPAGPGLALFQVVSASAIAYNKVRVTFDQEVKHSNPANADDSLKPANYTFSVIGTGVALTASSVALNQADPTIVDITLTGEMTDSCSYRVTVANVENIHGFEIDPDNDDATFVGLGVSPQVSSATVPAINKVRVVFDESMDSTAQLIDSTRYSISGPTTINVDSVAIVNSTTVELSTSGEMRTGVNNYTVTVGPPYTGIRDIAWNELDPAHHAALFSGVGIAPQVSSAVALDKKTIQITFNEPMQDTAEIKTAARYTFVGPSVVTAVSVIVLDSQNVAVTITETMLNSLPYTVSVGPPFTGIVDIAGNELDPAHNSAIFLGIAEATGIAEILIGDTVVWSSGIGSISQKLIELDVSGYTGVHKLTFRLRFE